jgi:hypothetical protein
MREDFDKLGVRSVAQLKSCEADDLYLRMCELTGARQDPCVHDTYRCAIEQARNPNLPEEQKDWWYWSRIRKSSRSDITAKKLTSEESQPAGR